MATRIPVAVESLELQLSAAHELSAATRKAIRAAGGRYSECRGYESVRVVILPVATGLEIAKRLVGEAVRTPWRASDTVWSLRAVTVIARGLKGIERADDAVWTVKSLDPAILETLLAERLARVEADVAAGWRVPRWDYTPEELRAAKRATLLAKADALRASLAAVEAELSTLAA